MTLVESLTCRRPKFVDVEILARLISDQKMSARWRESYQTNMLKEWWANLAYLFEFSLQVKSMNPDLHQVFCGNRLLYCVMNFYWLLLSICLTEHA